MITQRDYADKTLLSAAAATGAGTVFNVEKYRHIVVSVGTATSGNLTVKMQGSIQQAKPAFSSAQTVANHWDYIQMVDSEDGAAVDGDVGFAPVGTDDFRLFEMNVNGLRWLTANVTAYTAGSVTVKVLAFKD